MRNLQHEQEDCRTMRQNREELLDFAQASLALRWLVLASLIALEALTAAGAPTPRAPFLYLGILLYTFAFTVYAWRFPLRATSAARWAIPFDIVAIVAGMFLTTHAREFLVLGFLVAATAGLLLGRAGGNAAAAAIALAQLPGLRSSTFAASDGLAWAITALVLLTVANAAAAAAFRLSLRIRLSRSQTDLADVIASFTDLAAGAHAALDVLAKQFRADSGSIMVVDPGSGVLEIVASHRLDEAHGQARPRLGEGIAGWVVQEGRPVLLTPDSTIPFRLSRAEIGSSICLPLVAGGQPLGVVNLNRSTAAPWFARGDLETGALAVQPVASLLLRAQHDRIFADALAILAKGFREVGRALARDPAVLWPVLLDVARSLTAAQFAVMALERDDTGTVDIVAARGIGGSAARELLPALLAASTDGHIHTVRGPGAEVSESLAVFCLPLRVDTATIGALGLGLPADGAAPPPVLSAVAAHVAAAVHTARAAHRVADIGVVEERRRIAREMHDGLAQTLADALLQTDLSTMAAQANPAKLASDLKELRGLLERAMRELRVFMSDLRRQEDVEGGLLASVDVLAREFERRYAIRATAVLEGDDGRLPSAARHAVLAIIRQALTNVRSHAQASAVTIRAEVTDRSCSVSVSDNGVGFDLVAYRARPRVSHRLGLTSMEERAALVGGHLQIETAPGRGTTVSVRIPLGDDHG